MERRQSASATRVAGVAELSRQQGGVASRKAGPEATRARARRGAPASSTSTCRQSRHHLLGQAPAISPARSSARTSGRYGLRPGGYAGHLPKCWPDRLHPEDGREELPPLIRTRRRYARLSLPPRRRQLLMDLRHVRRSSTTNTDSRWSWSAPGRTFPSAGAWSSRRSRPTPNCRKPNARSAA